MPTGTGLERDDPDSEGTATTPRATGGYRLGYDAVDVVSEDEVIAGLADAVMKAQGGDPDGAVFEAGNAIESYLGHLRNAADHGVDQEIGAEWEIADNAGIEYVFVACSFIAAVTRRENGGPAIL